MPKRKIQSKKTEERKKLQTKAKEVEAETKTKRKPGPKKKTKQITGYNMLKRDENALVKSYAALEKKFDSFAESLNILCYENGDKKQAATKTNQAAIEFSKETIAFKKILAKTKSSLKPIYT